MVTFVQDRPAMAVLDRFEIGVRRCYGGQEPVRDGMHSTFEGPALRFRFPLA